MTKSEPSAATEKGMINEDMIITRLALIKLLFKTGLAQSRQAEPVAAFSILTFHDSIEMFLKLIAEHNEIRSDQFNFLDYWVHIPTLTLKESMRNLNARRVSIKHRGLLPAKGDIEISRVNATDFFNQNTKSQFGLEWHEISLLTLVRFETVRTYLEEAQKAVDKSNYKASIEKVAVGFNELIYQYEKNKAHLYGKSPFFFGKEMTFDTAFFMGIEDKEVARFVDKVKESIESIQDAIKVMSLGVDFRRFVKFKLLTPAVTRMGNGIPVVELWMEKKWTEENCQYCIDFVVESAIKLHEFDFDIQEIEDDPH